MTMHADDAQTIIARLAAQEREVLALRQEVTTLRARPLAPPILRRRRAPRFAALIVALLLALVPLALLAAGPFTDLDPASPHNDNIAAIQAAGITKGCDPPDFTLYCPKDNVTREEMASFLARLGGLGGNPPVANALTAQMATNAQHSTTAENAVTVGGYAPSGLARVGVGQQGDDITTTGTAWKTVAEVTLTAPGPGYVLVNGAVGVVITAGDSNFHRVQLVDVTEGHASPTIDPDVPQGYLVEHAPTYIFAVTVAGPHTYQLQFRAGGPQFTHVASNGMITALYVPFGPTGNTP